MSSKSSPDDELLDYTQSQGKSRSPYPEMEGYNFDNFVVGPSNKFAHAAAIAVANNPGKDAALDCPASARRTSCSP